MDEHSVPPSNEIVAKTLEGMKKEPSTPVIGPAPNYEVDPGEVEEIASSSPSQLNNTCLVEGSRQKAHRHKHTPNITDSPTSNQASEGHEDDKPPESVQVPDKSQTSSPPRDSLTSKQPSKVGDQNNNHSKTYTLANPDDPSSMSQLKQASLVDGSSQKAHRDKHTPNITMRLASPNHASKAKSSWRVPMSAVSVILPAVLSLFGYFFFTAGVTSFPQFAAVENRQVNQVNFSSLLKDLKSKYPEQPKHFWSNIIASLDNWLAPNSDPSIILLVHDESRSARVSQFAKELVGGINNLSPRRAKNVDSLTLDLKSGEMAKSIGQGDDDRVKLLLDQNLENIYRPGGKIALLENLQALPGKPALLFFTYGDDKQTCKFPGIILLMTMEVKSGEVKDYAQLVSNERDLNSFTQRHLVNLWKKQLNVDSQIKPLLTRIANIVLIFN